MIKSFRHKGLKILFEKGDASKIDAAVRNRIENALMVLNAAAKPEDANLPGYRLHELKGDRKGVWSLMVTANRRITFSFDGADARDVDLEDYH